MSIPLRLFSLIVCALMAVAAGCADARADAAPVIGESGALGAHTSQADIDAGALSLDQLVERGEALFGASFNTLDGAGRPETTDVSPNNFRPPREFPDNFNRISGPDANSCVSCHSVPRAGGGGDNATNVFVLADRLHFVNFDGGEGDGLERHTLRSVGNERASIGLFGSGYIELLAREMTTDLHAIRDDARREAKRTGADAAARLTSKGVDFGRITAKPDGTFATDEIEGVDDDLIIRPFMQKGTIVSLREFAVKALNQHFGMQATERFGDGVDHDGDGAADEVSRGDVTALVMFQATLPAPTRVLPAHPDARAAAERGEELFAAIGCVGCHVPELPLESAVFSEPNPFNPSGKLSVFDVESPYAVDLAALGGSALRVDERGRLMAPVFTDLKRHDMGATLDNETLEEEGVPTEQWLTRKLWGAADEPPFLHHGRATLMSEAVLAHGGEAQPSRDAYAALPPDDRAAVMEFLKTLRIPPAAAESAAAPRGSVLVGGVIWAAAGALAGAALTLLIGWGVLRFRRGRAAEPR